MSDMVGDGPSTMAYQVAIRSYTDIRSPAPEFLTALAGQFVHAEAFAQGRLCLSVPGAIAGDDTGSVMTNVLLAAATRHEVTAGTAVTVKVVDVTYTQDGYCHVFAQCAVTGEVGSLAAADVAPEAV